MCEQNLSEIIIFSYSLIVFFTSKMAWLQIYHQTSYPVKEGLEAWICSQTPGYCSVKMSVCSDEGLTLETSAKHHIPQATNIPYQPCWSNPYKMHSVLFFNTECESWQLFQKGWMWKILRSQGMIHIHCQAAPIHFIKITEFLCFAGLPFVQVNRWQALRLTQPPSH